jgi:hypothetical protein
VIVEGSADPDHPGNVKLVNMLVNPTFLLRKTEADPENIGSGSLDFLKHLLILGLRGRMERRAKCPRCDHPGKPSLQALAQKPPDPRFSAAEEMPPVATHAVLATEFQEDRPV